MSQIKFDRPLQVRLVYSPYHKFFLYCIHALAVVLMLLPFGLHTIIKLLIMVYTGMSLFYLTKYTKHLYAGTLHYSGENNWMWINGNNEEKLLYQHGVILHPQLLLLTFMNRKNKKYFWLLFPDSLDKDTFRRIRMLIRHSTAETISPPV